MAELETTHALPTITEESLVSSVLGLFPQCREVFQRHGGLRNYDGVLGPEEPVAWFAHRRRIPLDQFLTELNDAVHRGGTGMMKESPGLECRSASRSVEIFLRYGFVASDAPQPSPALPRQSESPVEAHSCSLQIWDALARCVDPRYPEHSLVDLGTVDLVRYDPRRARAEVTLMLSSSDSAICAGVVDQVMQRVGGVTSVREVRVTLAAARPLRPERMKPEVRQRLGLEW